MADTGSPWFIPYVEPGDLVRDYPAASEALGTAIAAGLSVAGTGIGTNAVSVIKSDTFSSSSSSFTDVTGLTLTITPSSASSLVFVVATINLSGPAENHTFQSRIVRQVSAVDTVVFQGDAASNRNVGFGASAYFVNQDSIQSPANISGAFIDSPATSSATTYKIQVRSNSGTGHVNRGRSDADSSNALRTASSIVAIEVAA